jgi:hypothetical protein
MKWNAIITKAQYERALRRSTEISNAFPDSREGDELSLLLILIKDYEDSHIEITGALVICSAARDQQPTGLEIQTRISGHRRYDP